MKFPALRISHRIAAIGLVGVLGVMAVTGLFLYERHLIAQINEMEAQAGNAAAVTGEVQTGFLQLRQHEKDFFLSNNEHHVVEHTAQRSEMLYWLNQLEEIIAQNQHRDIPEQGILTAGFERYINIFDIAANLNRRLGLTPDAGLRKELSTATAALTKHLANIPYPALKLDAAAISSGEKDFRLAPSMEARATVIRAIDILRKRPSGLFGSTESHQAVIGTLDQYQMTFVNYADILDKTASLKVQVADAFSQIEPVFVRINAEMENVRREVVTQRAETTSAIGRMVMIAVAVVLLAVVLIGLTVWRSVAAPISRTAGAMRQLASGDLDVTVPGLGRRDEIGEIASAFDLFRENTIRKVNEEREAAEARQRTEHEREMRELEEKEKHAAELQHSVDVLASALSQLADGDVTQQIEQPFTETMEQLRTDFNLAVAKLRSALGAVGDSAVAIHADSDQIRKASDDLSHRTEQQAASVEETAAALEQMVATVSDSSRRAEEAGQLVERTRTGAERSGVIVRDAVAAMDRIVDSSNQIGGIVSVIDEIAFQINLLALNAGVEAARAGDAGRGFAVVAQEVRGLAQRSASAAKEINALISASGTHVRDGVALVGQAGDALTTIVKEVQDISTNVVAIVEASKEQATGLQEINIAVNRIDQGTQQNAVMVGETTSASHKLAGEAEALNELLAQFRLGNHKTVTQQQPKPQMPSQTIRSSGKSTLFSNTFQTIQASNAAAVIAAVHTPDEGWEEF